MFSFARWTLWTRIQRNDPETLRAPRPAPVSAVGRGDSDSTRRSVPKRFRIGFDSFLDVQEETCEGCLEAHLEAIRSHLRLLPKHLVGGLCAPPGCELKEVGWRAGRWPRRLWKSLGLDMCILGSWISQSSLAAILLRLHENVMKRVRFPPAVGDQISTLLPSPTARCDAEPFPPSWRTRCASTSRCRCRSRRSCRRWGRAGAGWSWFWTKRSQFFWFSVSQGGRRSSFRSCQDVSGNLALFAFLPGADSLKHSHIILIYFVEPSGA